jgi:hypothetical protein
MLRQPAVSADPQMVGAAPFRMSMGPERTFNLTRQEEFRRISAMKAFLKPERDEGGL